jgi:hypothetical protein
MTPDQQTRQTQCADDWQREPLPDPFDDRTIQERMARTIAKAAAAKPAAGRWWAPDPRER